MLSELAFTKKLSLFFLLSLLSISCYSIDTIRVSKTDALFEKFKKYEYTSFMYILNADTFKVSGVADGHYIVTFDYKSFSVNVKNELMTGNFITGGMTGHFVNGLKEGEWKQINTNGILVELQNYSNGKAIDSKQYSYFKVR